MPKPRIQKLKTQAVNLLPNEVGAVLRKTRGKFERRTKKAKAVSKNNGFRRAVRASLELPIDSQKVFYESFDGNGALCNPRAIFEHIARDRRYSDFKHVWAVTSDSVEEIREALGDRNDIVFVEHKSERYFEELHSAKYLISNSTFPHEFMKRDGQVYLNTWHGTPLKKMGYDTPGGTVSVRNVIRNFLSADYLLSSNRFMTQQMYETAYKLRGIYPGKVIQAGTPRIDRQIVDRAGQDSVTAQLRARGVEVTPGNKVVVYAPTWKGTSVYSPVNNVDRLKVVVEQLRAQIDRSDVDILIKAHQLVFRQGQDDPDLKSMLVPNDFETNKILGMTDLLITDYSSIFFDFLATGNPIVFFVPDADGYEKARGLYFDFDELPGPVVRSYRELGQVVSGELAAEESPTATVREKWKKQFAGWEDGNSTSRVVDVLFGTDDGTYVADLSRSDKVRLLMYPGGMLNNGITRAAHNLLDSIDYEKYDVTLTTPYPRSKDKATNLDRINANCRIIARVGGVRLTGYEQSVYDNYLKRGVVDEASEKTLDAIFDREWIRMFGKANFDVIIDFDGYSTFNAGLLSHGNGGAKVIWGHNDLMRDSQREVKGKKVFEKQFRSIFSMYKGFDFLASVSSDLTTIHTTDLQEFFPPDRFVTVSNFLETEFISAMAYGSEATPAGSVDDAADHPTPVATTGTTIDAGPAEGIMSTILDTAIELYGWDDLLATLERKRLVRDYIRPGEGYTNFVTTGRLSPEKNQQMLIRSFAKIHESNPFTRLIIVGDGPLRGELENVAHAMGVSHSVVFAGHQGNPFPIVANSDCFVFSSLYEGQGLALLEALVLDVPVVTAEYNVVHSVLPKNAGLITEPTVDGLAQGMQSFIDGHVPTERFDTLSYNNRARAEFDGLIGRAANI